jgi:hypothetical protein
VPVLHRSVSRAQPVKQLRRAFDVGEEEGHRSSRQLVHRSMLDRRRRQCIGPLHESTQPGRGTSIPRRRRSRHLPAGSAAVLLFPHSPNGRWVDVETFRRRFTKHSTRLEQGQAGRPRHRLSLRRPQNDGSRCALGWAKPARHVAFRARTGECRFRRLLASLELARRLGRLAVDIQLPAHPREEDP